MTDPADKGAIRLADLAVRDYQRRLDGLQRNFDQDAQQAAENYEAELQWRRAAQQNARD